MGMLLVGIEKVENRRFLFFRNHYVHHPYEEK